MLKVRLVKLEDESCPGCSLCGAIEDQLGEIDVDWPLLGMEKVESGKLYTIRVCNESQDWETGQIDEWDLEVVEIPEN